MNNATLSATFHAGTQARDFWEAGFVKAAEALYNTPEAQAERTRQNAAQANVRLRRIRANLRRELKSATFWL